MLPPKMVPTILRVRQESGRRMRMWRKSAAMKVTLPPVPR